MTDVRELEKQYSNKIKRILNRNIHHISILKPSSYIEDTQQCFDAVYSFNNANIAIRIRKPKYISYRDLTIRCRSLNGYRTEFDKLSDGFGDYYFYGWENKKRNSFHSYILVDINAMRDTNLMFNHDEYRENHDGTAFYSYSIESLIKNDCLKIYEEL